MRPTASTAVASMQKTAAPDSASELMCVKCQSLASPSTAKYWHIGATMMRLASVRPRSVMEENKALMRGFPMCEIQLPESLIEHGSPVAKLTQNMPVIPGRAKREPGMTTLLLDPGGLDHFGG